VRLCGRGFSLLDARDLTAGELRAKISEISETASHSAAGQAAGYEYQRQLSLVLG
jgi:hypothetical protein